MTNQLVTEETIEQYIEKWHEGNSQQSLHDYLGLTWDQYKAWAETGKIPKIEKVRRMIELDDGKYTVINDLDVGGGFKALRHGEEWQNLAGDKLILALFHELEKAKNALADVCVQLDARSGTPEHPTDLTLRDVTEIYQVARLGLGKAVITEPVYKETK